MSDGYEIVPATRGDAGEIYNLQRACWLQEAMANETFEIPTIHESLAVVEAGLLTWQTFVVQPPGASSARSGDSPRGMCGSSKADGGA